MIELLPPPDEAERLQALRALHLLDTPPEERFDRITRLATRLFGVPFAAITLLDESRLWFKSNQGLGASELPRQAAICAHTVAKPDRTLIIADASLDADFRNNPLVSGPHGIRFYAGHPLMSPDGHALGTFCILDRQPRELSAYEVATVRDLAKMAEEELTASEINEAMRLVREAEEGYRSIFENVAEGIFQILPDGRYANANPAVAKVYGYERVDDFMAGVRDFARQQQVVPARRDELLRELQAHGRVNDSESEIYRRDGSTVWIAESIHTVYGPAGECLYYQGTVHDVTTQKYAAAAQAQARDEALTSAQIKSDFLSMMSHEIRTPMHGIIGMTGLLLNTELKPEQGELVRLIASCGDNLLSLINNALDFSKIEAGCLELDNQPFTLRHSLKEVIDLLSIQASSKGVTLACEVDPRIPEVLVSDVTRVRQILFNLISNSMKFTPPEGRVDVVVTGHQLSEPVENHGHSVANEPWMFHFTVRDTGEGIPEDKLHRLFRPFSQADSSISRKHGGTGLGLAICHRLCEMLGGAIWLESEPGLGSNFEFTIKAAAAPAGAPARDVAPEPTHPDVAAAAVAVPRELSPHAPLAASPSAALPAVASTPRPLKILLAEDNVVNQRVAMGLLKQIGYTASTANNGREAVDALEDTLFDVVLMDVQMPEMDGLEATREIRRRWPDGLRRPYIIAMTANAMTGDREKCLDAGMDEYITKPVKAVRLKTALEQCCDLRAAVAAAIQPPNFNTRRSTNGGGSTTLSNVTPANLNRDSLEALKSLQAEGDDGFLKEMVDLFLADTPARLADMETALAAGQQPEFVRAVHSIKGASANFGADDLHNICAEIEGMGRAGRMNDAAAELKRLYDEFERVRMALLAEV